MSKKRKNKRFVSPPAQPPKALPSSPPIKASSPERHWFHRWFRAPKPTEWIVAITALLSALYVWNSGIIDAKRSELSGQNAKLEANQIELKSQNRKLEADERDLKEKIGKANADIFAKQSALDSTLAELESSKERLSKYITNEYYLKQLTHLVDTDQHKRPKEALFCNPTIDKDADTMELRLGVSGSEGMQFGRVKDRIEPISPLETKEVFDVLPRLRGLQGLYVDSVQLNGTHLDILSNIKSLRFTYLTNCGLNDSSLERLKVHQNVNYICLAENQLTKLPSIDEKWAIQMLDVSDTQVGDSQLVPLLDGAINLISLDLNNTPITDKTLDAIKKNTVELSTVQILGTKVSFEGIKSFIERVSPKWIIVDWISDKYVNEIDEFVKRNNLNTGVVAIKVNGRVFAQSKLVGCDKNVRDMTPMGKSSFVFTSQIGEFQALRAGPSRTLIFPAR